MKLGVVVRMSGLVASLATAWSAGAQATFTLSFDGGEAGVPTTATDFSYEGSNWAGGFIATQGMTEFYASGLFSYHVDAGTATVSFDTPVDSVTLFYVHGGAFGQGTATAFYDHPTLGPTQIGQVVSNVATVFNDPANFKTIDPADPISSIEFNGGVIDNFSYTTLAPPAPLDDPIPAPITPGDVYIELQPVVSGLASPLGARFPDDGTGRMFVYDQTGLIHIVESGAVTGTLLDVTSRLVALMPNFDERGLIGFTLHPNFTINGLIYTYTSEPVAGPADFTVDTGGQPMNHQGVIAEWQVVGNAVNMASRREILRVDEPQFNHNGGPLHFGPDGYLYIAFGDGGNGDDEGPGHGTSGNGQNKDTILGSLVRIDVDGGSPLAANGEYGIPPDNPFVGTAGLDEIYAYGLRNPYGFSFDASTGDLYLVDVGQNDIEELNIVTNGGNYGWRIKEGSFLFEPNGTDPGYVTGQQTLPGLIDPIAEYDHDEGRSIIGGFKYNGSDPAFDGLYITGDFSRGFAMPGGRLFYVNPSNQFREFNIGFPPQPLGLFLKGFAEDLDGNIYVCGSQNLAPAGSNGVVLRMTSAVENVPVSGPWSAWLIVVLMTTAGAAVALRPRSAQKRFRP